MKPRMTEDAELVAIHGILAYLTELDQHQRTRVMDYVISRAEALGLDAPRQTNGSAGEIELGQLTRMEFPDPPEAWPPQQPPAAA